MTLIRDVECDVKTGKTAARQVDVPQSNLDALAAADGAFVQQESVANTIAQQAGDALAANTAYIAIASPTNAQVAAQVKALTRQNNKIIRLLLRKLDGTD